MNVLIVGGGVVGTATGLGLQRLGHNINVVDSNVDCRAAHEGLYVGGPIMGEVDIVLICVPESEIDPAAFAARRPSLRQLLRGAGDPAVYIRSSVPVGTCSRLTVKSRGGHFGHNPEFLREAVAEYEFLNPPGIILGDCCEKHGRLMNNLYEPFRVPILHTRPEVSELVKLAVNSYLACQVSFWGQIKLIGDLLGINSHEVGALASFGDSRVSIYGSRMHGRKYGGKCLPKDLAQLQLLADKLKVSSPLLKAIKEINDLMP